MATNILSPRSSGDGDVLSSPQSRRSRVVSSPWTQIVRGADLEPVASIASAGETVLAAAPSSPSPSDSVLAFPSDSVLESSSSDWPTSKPPAPATSPPWSADDDFAAEPQPESSDNNAAKKQAWKKPSNGNGNGGTAVEVSPVMDTALWPALSACTKASPKSASSDSLKALSEGSLLPSQGSGVASLSPNKPVIANNANPNSTPNHVTLTRQRSMKRGSTNGGFIQPSPPLQSQGPAVEMPPGKPGNTTGESSHKEGGQRGGFGSDHQPQRSNSFNRRGSGGQHPRGDGSYHHNYGGRRDQDRGNQDWNNPHRNFGSRDNHMQPQRVVPRGFARGPHTSPAFIPPPPVPVRPFGNPMVYPEVPPSLIYVAGPPPESLRGVPIMAPAHPMYFPPVPDPQLHAKIVNQIDYYFSNDNLIKDTFLRQNMDDQGWVPIKLIAGFKKVMHLTDNIQFILNAVQASTVVEVQNDKIRKRNEWMKWIMPPGPFSPVSSPQSLARSSHDMLAGQFQGITLDEKTTHGHTEMFSRSSSGEFNSQLQQSGGEGTVQAGFERKTLAGKSK